VFCILLQEHIGKVNFRQVSREEGIDILNRFILYWIMVKSTFQINFNDLKISTSQSVSIMGFKEGEDAGMVKELIDEILKESGNICNIRGEFNIYSGVEFVNDDKSITLNNINFQVKKIVYGQLKNSESIAVFLCTAGEEIGLRSKKAMQDGDYLKGYVYDLIGSEIVEAASDLLQSELEKIILPTGKKVTNRYNPGYCGWSVGEQHKLFQLIPDNFCGIKLTQSALMDPVKSASGFIGIGERVRYNPYTCSLCDLTDCNYRKVREKV